MLRISASRRETAAGVFVLVALAGALYFVWRAVPWAGSHDVHLHAVLGQSYGLRAGSPVRMAGITVGRVTSARLLAGGATPGRVRVDFFVSEVLDGERLADLFPEVGAPPATITPEGNLLPGGQNALTIAPGSVGPREATGSHAQISVIEPDDLRGQAARTLAEIRGAAVAIANAAESIDRLCGDGRALAGQVASLSTSLQDAIGRPMHDGVPPAEGTLVATIASAESLLRAAQDPDRGTVGRLVATAEVHDELLGRLDHADEVLAESQRAIVAIVADARRLADTMTRLTERADRVGVAAVVTGDDATGARITSLLASAERTLAHLEATAARLPAAADGASRVVAGGERLVRDAEDGVVGARRNWLLSGLFSEPADPWLRVYDFGESADDARDVGDVK